MNRSSLKENVDALISMAMGQFSITGEYFENSSITAMRWILKQLMK